jgi:hypothetical protein
MKDRIIEVQKYFKAKLLTGDFKVKSIEQYVICLTIDDEFEFSFWIGNLSIKGSFQSYFGGDINFMSIPFTQKESEKMKSLLSKDIKEFFNNIVIKEKQKQLEQIQEQLQKLTA